MNEKGKGREKGPGNPQGLSRWALARKRARDVREAKKDKRKEWKAHAQRVGQRSDSDIHHMEDGTYRRVDIAYNRASWLRNEVNKSKLT